MVPPKFLFASFAFYCSMLIFPLQARGAGVLEKVDFKNAIYPTADGSLGLIPRQVRLIPINKAASVRFRSGRYRFPCDEGAVCPLLTLDKVSFGPINSLSPSTAIATLRTTRAVPLLGNTFM
jgi:hypothetical protein